MKIVNKNKNTVLAQEAYVADTIFSRVKGLLGRQSLKEGTALIIKPCNSIHTFFMRFAIDVVFVDRANRVVKIISKIRPNRMSGIYFRAFLAIELPAGTIDKTLTDVFDTIILD